MNNKYTFIKEHFKLPIEFEKNTTALNKDVKSDLGFNTNDTPYNILFNSYDSSFNQILIDKWQSNYSTSKQFLKSKQKFISLFNKLKHNEYNNDISVIDTFIDYKNNDSFKEKYEFVAWEHLEFMNKNPYILQGLTYYNLFSPAINIVIPIIMLLSPFIIIKFALKKNISFHLYKELLFKQLKNHSLGKIFSLFSNDITVDKKIVASLGIAFYFFSLYQNSLTCIKFYKNAHEIQNYLFSIKTHINNSIDHINEFIDICGKISYFNHYKNYLVERKNKLYILVNEFEKIKNNSFSIKDIVGFGDVLLLFYKLRCDKEWGDIINFTFGLQCFRNNMCELSSHIRNQSIHKCSFKVSSKHNTILKEQYYPYHMKYKNLVKNDTVLQNYVITGPNASGKTTILKTTLLNILFSQQFGYGFYKKANIIPYTAFHSYINIPDTSGRDSLFQAEARRCLEILKDVKQTKGRTLIVFDEIYSGTNPYEATKSAVAFLDVLKNEKVDFMLTTHFKELTEMKGVLNYHMDCSQNGDKIEYMYTFKKGVSNIKGGFTVLRDLEYPDEIINRLHR